MSTPVSPDLQARLRHRRWADAVVIVLSVYAFFAAIWAPPEMATGADAEGVGSTGWMYLSYAIGGALGILGIFIAHKAEGVGRAVVLLAGIVVLSGFFALYEVTLIAVISLGVTGLGMLAAAPWVGPMPTPEQEGMPRRGLG